MVTSEIEAMSVCCLGDGAGGLGRDILWPVVGGHVNGTDDVVDV